VYNATKYWSSGVSGFEIAANIGVRGVVNTSEEFDIKRSQSLPNYFYLRGNIQHTENLPNNWQLFGKLSGQITQDPLVSNEQFAIGGAETVRAYLESSVLGDTGINGTFELRNASLAKWLKQPPGAAYFLVFYDAGIVSILNPLPSQTSSFDISSWGAGLRIRSVYGFDVAVDWANALQDYAAIKQGDQRVHFSARYTF
jgi:hemolysin activation/secretion protein